MTNPNNQSDNEPTSKIIHRQFSEEELRKLAEHLDQILDSVWEILKLLHDGDDHVEWGS